MKVLFLTEGEPERGLSPAARFRVYQYIPFLEAQGVQCIVRPSVPPKYFMCRPGYAALTRRFPPVAKLVLLSGLILMILNRLRDLPAAARADVVFVQRNLLPLGPGWLERLFRWVARRLVFDFDDALFTTLNPEHRVKGWKRLVLGEGTLAENIRMADLVIAGNEYLREYASRYNPRVAVLPTGIDVDYFRPRSPAPLARKEGVVLGWSGTSSNLPYLTALAPVFKRLSREYPITLKVVSDGAARLTPELYTFPGVMVVFEEWNMEREREGLWSFDIGLMPLPDNPWTRGKCGFKAIQYMSVGVPAVCSPVGVNTKIIRDGENGFLAAAEEEWIQKLALLIQNPDLRYLIGGNGRRFVEGTFDIMVLGPRLLSLLQTVCMDRSSLLSGR